VLRIPCRAAIVEVFAAVVVVLLVAVLVAILIVVGLLVIVREAAHEFPLEESGVAGMSTTGYGGQGGRDRRGNKSSDRREK
jgi:hypothetical protein